LFKLSIFIEKYAYIFERGDEFSAWVFSTGGFSMGREVARG